MLQTESFLIVSRDPASPNSAASFAQMCLPGQAAARPIWSRLKDLSYPPPACSRETDISLLRLIPLFALQRCGLELLP